MSSVLDDLWDEARGAFERLPVWLPGTPMKLGDIGTFNDHGWVKHTTLADVGVAFAADTVGEPVDYDYTSSNGAEVTIGASTTIPAGGAADASLELDARFSRAGAFILKSNSVAVHRIADVARVHNEILQRYADKTWLLPWVVVTEVAVGGPTIVLISASNQAHACVKLDVDSVVPGAPMLGAGFALTSSRAIAASFVSRTRTGVLWRGQRVEDPWFRRPRIDDRDHELVSEPAAPSVADTPAVAATPYVVDIEYPQDADDGRPAPTAAHRPVGRHQPDEA